MRFYDACTPRWPNSKHQTRLIVLLHESTDHGRRSTQELFNFVRRTVRDPKPNDFGGRSPKHAQLLKIRVFGYDCKPVFLCIPPDRCIIGTLQTALANVRTATVNVGRACVRRGERFSSKSRFTRSRFPACARGLQRTRGKPECRFQSDQGNPLRHQHATCR